MFLQFNYFRVLLWFSPLSLWPLAALPLHEGDPWRSETTDHQVHFSPSSPVRSPVFPPCQIRNVRLLPLVKSAPPSRRSWPPRSSSSRRRSRRRSSRRSSRGLGAGCRTWSCSRGQRRRRWSSTRSVFEFYPTLRRWSSAQRESCTGWLETREYKVNTCTTSTEPFPLLLVCLMAECVFPLVFQITGLWSTHRNSLWRETFLCTSASAGLSQSPNCRLWDATASCSKGWKK